MLTINEIGERLIPIFEKNNIKRAMLFGSYATGIASQDSDVDLVIDNNGKSLGLDFFQIAVDCGEILGVSVDLFEFREIELNSEIEKDIKDEGILIYED